MSLNVHTDIELTPTTTKVLAPLWRFSAKRSRPNKKRRHQASLFLASLKTQRERGNVAWGLPFPERDPREARERAGKGKPQADN